jgi:hypothetical protein
MLQKNVYIVYPAGYHGSYVKWAIEVSDIDRRAVTVLDPLNRSSSTSHGGVGTSHGHVRIPTHQGFDHHANWVIRNRPADPMVYIINATSQHMDIFCKNIVQILLQDPTGIIITINDGNDRVTQSYGRINCVTKWPTFLAAANNANNKIFGMHENFDPFDCAHDRLFRNSMVSDVNQLTENVWDFARATAPLDFENLKKHVTIYDDWYQVRNQYQPHEVNESTYPSRVDYKNRLYQLNTRDIPSDKFLSQLQDILTTTGISNNFNLDIVNNYHCDYVSTQPNLQWIDSFAHWDQTGELDSYLLSHSIIEAEIIREIMIRCHVRFDFTDSDHEHWRSFYSVVSRPGWPAAPLTELGFYQLPDWIQQEMLQSDYILKHQREPNPVMTTLDWQNMSLQDINQVYQTQIKSQN